MSTGKIILFYKFVPVENLPVVRLWQKNLMQRLGLKGRIIIADHGINGTLGGQEKDVKAYIKEMKEYEPFKKIQYKWSVGNAADFPRVSVKIRSELITLAPDEEFDVYGSSKGLKPDEWHKYIEENPEVIILDARNDYESDIGVFRGKNLMTPQIKAFKEIKDELDKLPKDRPILTYCTGDVRCEYLSAYMKHKGFKEVHHLDGGIVKYGDKYGDEGHWDGTCFVFDRRMNLAFSDKHKDIGQCVHCQGKTSRHINCDNVGCNRLILVCDNCNKRSTCSTKCQKLVAVNA